MKNRNYQIDILRIIAMIMVLVLHVFGHGGMIQLCASRKDATWLLEAFAFVGVDVFAIISGYVYTEKGIKANLAHILRLYAIVWFYSVFASILFSICFSSSVSMGTVMKSLFPVITKSYWYFTAYFALAFFMPMVCRIADMATTRECIAYLTIGVTLFSIVSVMAMPVAGDIFMLNNGYSFLWLSFLAYIGRAIRKFRISSKKFYGGYIICCLLVYSLTILIEDVTQRLIGKEKGSNLFYNYQSIFVLAASVCLFCWILNRNKNYSMSQKRMIEKISSTSFAAYLITDHPVVRKNMECIKDLYVSLFPMLPKVVYILLVCMILFGGCILVDLIRQKLFDIANVDERLKRTVYRFADMLEYGIRKFTLRT